MENLVRSKGARKIAKSALKTAIQSQYAPQQYGQQQYAPQQYAPQQYAPQQYAPQQYAPQQYAPQQYAPQQYAPQQYSYQGGTKFIQNSASPQTIKNRFTNYVDQAKQTKMGNLHYEQATNNQYWREYNESEKVRKQKEEMEMERIKNDDRKRREMDLFV